MLFHAIITLPIFAVAAAYAFFFFSLMLFRCYAADIHSPYHMPLRYDITRRFAELHADSAETYA